MEAIKAGKVDFDEIETWPAGKFEYAYDSLVRVLEKPRSTKTTPSVHTAPSNNPVSNLPSSEPYTPPNQTTTPGNPDFSGSSHITASSTESKAEHFTQSFAELFVRASQAVLKLGKTMPWLKPEEQFYFSMTSVLCLIYY